MTDVSSDFFFNPLEPGYTDNPYPHLSEMRRLDPVHASPIGTWMLFGYDDCFKLLRDPGMSVDDKQVLHQDEERIAAFVEAAGGDLDQLESTSILGIDPPDHTRLRRLVSKAFTPPHHRSPAPPNSRTGRCDARHNGGTRPGRCHR